MDTQTHKVTDAADHTTPRLGYRLRGIHRDAETDHLRNPTSSLPSSHRLIKRHLKTSLLARYQRALRRQSVKDSTTICALQTFIVTVTGPIFSILPHYHRSKIL